MLYDVYGEKSLTERQWQNWFARFRSGDFHLKDAPRSGHPTEVDDDKIKAMIENNRCSRTRKIAEKLNISHTCVKRHLKQLGYDNKLDIWVPHKLYEIQLTKRIPICDSLLKRNETDPFLRGVSLSRTFEKSIFFVFFLFQLMELLSENIVAKFYSPYRNSFDDRVPSSGSA